MTIAFRAHLLTAAIIVAGAGAAPVSAQLLGGAGGGAIGAAGNLEGTLSSGGSLDADRIGSAAGRISNSVKGSARTSSHHAVNTRSGHVAADSALDGAVSHSSDTALGANAGNGGAAGGAASSTSSAGAGGSVSVSADLIGTDQVARTGGAARRTAIGVVDQAHATARGAATVSRNAAGRTVGYAHRRAISTAGAARQKAGTATRGSIGLGGSASVNASGSANADMPRR